MPKRVVFLQVLEVTAGQLVVGNDLDLAIALLGDLDGLAEVADATLNLDLLVQELLEGGDIEDLVAGRLRSVDDELNGGFVRLPGLRTRPTRNVGVLFAYLLGSLGRLALSL